MPYAVFNSYIYLANKLHKAALIYDEAHTAINLLQDRAKDRLWAHDYHYPRELSTYADLIGWLRMRETKTGLDEKQQMLLDELTSGKPRYVVEAGEDLYYGEMKRCLKLLPVDVRDQPPILWPPSKTKKIFLLSATIGKPDVVQLGLDKKRVKYYSAPSPVSPERRPITFMPVGSLGVASKARTLPLMAKAIEQLAARFPTEKGMLHCTYEIARELHSMMGEGPLRDRLLFHTKENRTETVGAFKAFAPASGKILVGCGLEEGLDLIGDLARFQIIVKVPWPSLEEPAIRYMAGQDPEWYNWQTVKKVLQASGRIVRSTTDQGETFILDSSFQRLYDEARDMMPQWWLDALVQEDSV
jgi:Rad3-related DNA helicase